MPVTVSSSGKPPRWDSAKAARIVAALVPGLVLARTAAGRDMYGRPFAPYSARYRAALADAGEDGRVDLRLTGGMLNSVKARDVAVTPTSATVTVGPDTGTSPRVVLADGVARRTGQRGPAHAVVGFWLHHGTPHMRPRPWAGLDDRDRKSLARALERAGLWGQGP